MFEQLWFGVWSCRCPKRVKLVCSPARHIRTAQALLQLDDTRHHVSLNQGTTQLTMARISLLIPYAGDDGGG